MFKVCDQFLRVVSEWATLAAAKASARTRHAEFPQQAWFVCDWTGMVVAGYGGDLP